MKRISSIAIVLVCLSGLVYAQRSSGRSSSADCGAGSNYNDCAKSSSNDRRGNDRDWGGAADRDSRVTQRATEGNTRSAQTDRSPRSVSGMDSLAARLDAAVDRFRSAAAEANRASRQAQSAEAQARYEAYRGSDRDASARNTANEAARDAWAAQAIANRARKDAVNASNAYREGARQQERAASEAAAAANRREEQRWEQRVRDYYRSRGIYVPQ